jgi:ketosteroid isomerase-like protein
MNKIFPFVILMFLFSCTSKKKVATENIYTEKIALMDADRAFSTLSEEKGMRNAFMEFMDSNAVLLRPDHLPIIGARAIEYLLEQNDSAYTLKWQPHNAMVARSADLGYTFGIWALQPKGQDTVLYGTYVSIWKKQQDGKWKYVLDAGNDGLGEPE